MLASMLANKGLVGGKMSYETPEVSLPLPPSVPIEAKALPKAAKFQRNQLLTPQQTDS